MSIGTALAIVGFAMYSHLKLQKRGGTREGLLPLAAGEPVSKKDSGLDLPHKDRNHAGEREEKIRAHPTSH